jgi:hypothetical protein
MSGAQVLGPLRRIRLDVKVILASAYGRETATADEPADMTCGFFRKPCFTGTLLALLRDVTIPFSPMEPGGDAPRRLGRTP